MTLLVITPDYASHVLPLLSLAGAWRDAGERVVVATGPATAELARVAGFEVESLVLGRGSNPGIIRPEEQPTGEDDNLRAFFDATRLGPVATLRYQADARANDLLWRPVETGRRVLQVVERVAPDDILVDHLSFAATLVLRAAGIAYGDVVLGHPSALPVGDEVYGFPTAWPSCIEPDHRDLGELLRRCREVRDEFTARCNAAARRLVPGADEVHDGFAAHGDRVLLAYPADLHEPARMLLVPPGSEFLGSCQRTEDLPAHLAAWLHDDRQPLVYVSFGSFLSARDDVLARVVDGLRSLDVRVALASGSADPTVLGAVPDTWLVRPFLPQVALVGHAAATVTHGGNNTVTESLASGVPMVVLPFSTDQFAGAAAVERAGCGVTLAPNDATAADIAMAVEAVLGGPAANAASGLGAAMRADPGPARARRALLAQPAPGRSPSR